jgi:hypothetical protein
VDFYHVVSLHFLLFSIMVLYAIVLRDESDDKERLSAGKPGAGNEMSWHFLSQQNWSKAMSKGHRKS